MSLGQDDIRIGQITAVGLGQVSTSTTGDHVVGGEVPPEWSPWPLSVVTVETTQGQVGVGTVYSDVRLVRATLEVLEPLYRHERVLEPARVIAKLWQHAAWMGRGGAVDHTLSGIDVALWDLAGKALGQPVGRLLGGRYRDRIRPYASIMATEHVALDQRLQQLAERGFRAFKVRVPTGASDEQFHSVVSSARAAVGPVAELMIDAGGSDAFWPHGFAWAARMSDLCADYGVAWLEEPLRPEAVDDYCRLRARSRTPIAAGEALVGRTAFLPFLERGGLDVVQPDVSKVGGLTVQRRIAESAEDHGVRYVGHGSFTAVGLAADLQLASALPGVTLVEVEVDSPYFTDLVLEPFDLGADGMLTIPERPGLGVSLRPEVTGPDAG